MLETCLKTEIAEVQQKYFLIPQMQLLFLWFGWTSVVNFKFFECYTTTFRFFFQEFE